MRSPKLAALELKRFGRGKLPRRGLVALLLLPLLYGALYLWSFWDPYSRLDKIPVALVNDDRGATGGGKKIAAGDDIAEGLRDSKTFDWHEVSAAEAAKGVENGTYYLSLTMPEDFSKRIASSSGDTPRPARSRCGRTTPTTTSSAQISRTVFSEVRTAASTNSSRAFLDKIFISFSDIARQDRRGGEGRRQAQGRHRQGQEGLGKDSPTAWRTPKKGAAGSAGGLTEAATRARASWRPGAQQGRGRHPGSSPTRSTASPARCGPSSGSNGKDDRRHGPAGRRLSPGGPRQPRQAA